MNGNPVNISETNTILREQIKRVLNCKDMAKNKSDTGMIQSSHESAEKAPCSICNRNVKSKSQKRFTVRLLITGSTTNVINFLRQKLQTLKIIKCHVTYVRIAAMKPVKKICRTHIF